MHESKLLYVPGAPGEMEVQFTVPVVKPSAISVSVQPSFTIILLPPTAAGIDVISYMFALVPGLQNVRRCGPTPVRQMAVPKARRAAVYLIKKCSSGNCT
jgi:hypothetical protein